MSPRKERPQIIITAFPLSTGLTIRVPNTLAKDMLTITMALACAREKQRHQWLS